ncbi:MAG: hypothetical protein M1826_003075 [Phylliscum demangeonii]|nr:MAG: hypothetical protein M1826_003075 [Phylliscum demangeonii]
MDGYQGEEASIVILDFAITSVPGFVRDQNRLNVAITRQRDGLIVIADKAPVARGMEEAHCQDFTILMRYLSVGWRKHSLDSRSELATCPYVRGHVYQYKATNAYSFLDPPDDADSRPYNDHDDYASNYDNYRYGDDRPARTERSDRGGSRRADD